MDRNAQIAREAKLRQINAQLQIANRQARAHLITLEDLQKKVDDLTRMQGQDGATVEVESGPHYAPPSSVSGHTTREA